MFSVRIGKETVAEAVVGFMVWTFRRPKSQGVGKWAPGSNALRHFENFLHGMESSTFQSPSTCVII